MRVAPILATALLAAGAASAQERSADAIVFVRVTASVTITRQDGSERRIEDAQIRTGTGTIVTRFGHIVTNDHIISGGTIKTRMRNGPVTVAVNVKRIETCFPPARSDRPSGCLEASVLGTDPQLDLAVLTMSGNDFPYVPFGDSDAVRTGSAVSAAGYPLGEELDIGRDPGGEGLAPTIAGGQVSALRADEQGNVRYIQTSAPLNPGNSGGPLFDEGGFAIGIVEAKVREATAIGFAIPINTVKDFLARNGVDAFLPSTRLTLGYFLDSQEKRIRMQVPAGFEDAARSRLMVDSGSSLPGVSLRIDRVASPWTADQIENALLQGGVFEPTALTRARASSREERVVRGEAHSDAGGRPIRTLYAIVDLGDEKVVARYVGGAEQVAFNASVLAASLGSLEAAPMLVPGAREPSDAPWLTVSQPNIIRVMPSGWVVDAGAPLPCGELPPLRESVVTAPLRDFTVSFRTGLRDAGLDVRQAAAQCAAHRGTSSEAEYHYTFSRLGIEYSVEGRFSSAGSRVMQVEVVAPTRKLAAARDVFSRWIMVVLEAQP